VILEQTIFRSPSPPLSAGSKRMTLTNIQGERERERERFSTFLNILTRYNELDLPNIEINVFSPPFKF
jgi:hypothetical protein